MESAGKSMNRNDYFVELKKHSHQQWIRDLLDLLPVAIYECNEFAVLQYYNRRAAELWGREPNCDQTGPRFCGSLRLYRTDGTLLPHAETPMAEVLLTGVPVNN